MSLLQREEEDGGGRGEGGRGVRQTVELQLLGAPVSAACTLPHPAGLRLWVRISVLDSSFYLHHSHAYPPAPVG